MKPLPIASLFCCAVLLAGCGHPPQASSDEKDALERLQGEKEAQRLSELHEREAAVDERERLLARREQAAVPPAPPVEELPPPAQVSNSPPQPMPQASLSQAATPPPPPAVPAAPSSDANYQQFYDALAQFGSWYQLAGYGNVWQPVATTLDPQWRPYTQGHWVFTDDGWTWVSDEPFGWITYHYGRWMRTQNLAWIWVPGAQWAPAWVSWRYGAGYVGWAPLPPEAGFDPAIGIQQWADGQYHLGPADYTFIPEANFGDENLAQDATPTTENGPIYDNSNNCTKIYFSTDSAAIVCYGPSYDFMRSKSRRPLQPQLTLRRTGFRRGALNDAKITGNMLEVPAPRIVRGAAPAAPRFNRGTVNEPRLIAPRNPPAAPAARSIAAASGSPNAFRPPARSPAGAGFPATQSQLARDQELIQRQRAAAGLERARQEEEANRAAAEQQTAAITARAKATQAATQAAAHAQAVRQAQPIRAPQAAGSPVPAPGRTVP